jgi:hypothetical protein
VAYTPYTIGHPDGSTGTGATFATQLQNNLNALLHSVVSGQAKSWNMTVTAGTGSAAMPQYMTYSNGVYRIRKTITWNGVNGNVTSVLYEFSSNSGALYEPIGTCTFSYDGSQNLTGWTWS